MKLKGGSQDLRPDNHDDVMRQNIILEMGLGYISWDFRVVTLRPDWLNGCLSPL